MVKWALPALLYALSAVAVAMGILILYYDRKAAELAVGGIAVGLAAPAVYAVLRKR